MITIHWLTILVSLVLVGLPIALMARRIQSAENLIDKQMVVIVAQDEHIAQLKIVNQCNDRIIELKDRHIENANRRADNFEYLYNLARRTCEACQKENATCGSSSES